MESRDAASGYAELFAEVEVLVVEPAILKPGEVALPPVAIAQLQLVTLRDQVGVTVCLWAG